MHPVFMAGPPVGGQRMAALAASLQTPEVPEGEPVGVGAEMDEAGQLAAWLIHQAKI